MRPLEHRGYLMTEAALGLMLIGVIMTSLVIAIVRQNRASAALADTRALVAMAEDAMTRLQSGTLPSVPPHTKLTLTHLPKDGLHPRIWVELTVHQGARSFALTGLVPRASWEKWQQSQQSRPATTAPAEAQP